MLSSISQVLVAIRCVAAAIVAIGSLESIANCQKTASTPKERTAFLDQADCPLHAIPTYGSILELENKSDRGILRYGLVCFAKKRDTFEEIDAFPVLDPRVAPHGNTTEGGFDASPLNLCKREKGNLGISFVEFEDHTRWTSKWRVKSVDGIRSPQ